MKEEEQYGRRVESWRKGLDAFPSTGFDLDIFERGLWLIFSANEGRKGERMQRLEMENSGKMKMPLAAYNASRATAKWGFQKPKSRRRTGYRFDGESAERV